MPIVNGVETPGPGVTLETINAKLDQVISLLPKQSLSSAPVPPTLHSRADTPDEAYSNALDGYSIDGYLTITGATLSEARATFYAGADHGLTLVGFANGMDLVPSELEAARKVTFGGPAQAALAWQQQLKDGLTLETWFAEELRRRQAKTGTPDAGPSGG